jgi:phosphoglycolate phosphatase
MTVPRAHVLLDLDGTISDSSVGIARSLRHAFVACGYDPPSDDEVRTVIGPPFEVGLPTLGIPLDDVARVAAAYRERYEVIGLFENDLYPGIVEMLDELTTAGFVLVLATAKPEDTAVRIIDHFGLTRYFTAQAGASHDLSSGRRTKAEVIAWALVHVGLTSHTTGRAAQPVVMVGDREHDVDGARANGIPCIGVTWGFGSVAELTQAGAVTLVDHPRQVAAAVAATYRS